MNYKLAGFGRQTQLLFFELMSVATRVTPPMLEWNPDSEGDHISLHQFLHKCHQLNTIMLRLSEEVLLTSFISLLELREQFLEEEDAPVTS